MRFYHLLGLGSILAAGIAAPAHAQRQDEQLWLQVNATAPVAPDVRITIEQIARFSDRQRGLFQTDLGALLAYRLAPNVEVAIGYRRNGAHNGNLADDQNRLRQQIGVNFGRLTTRLRLDQHFDPDGQGVEVRVRPLVRYNLPIGDRGAALFASHESFWLPHSIDGGQRRGYDRMRNLIGTVLPIGKSIATEVGYLNQYRLARNGARAQVDHALSVQLTITLDTDDR